MDKETKAEETKDESSIEEFVQSQLVVSVELKHPMQHGKRTVNFLDITMFGGDSIGRGSIEVKDGALNVATDMPGVSEHFPMENVVKWRIDSHMIPALVGYEFDTYKYEPYTYPERLGGYLGSYSNSSGCIAFLDVDMQITYMKDLEA